MKTNINVSPPASPRFKCTLPFLCLPQQCKEDEGQEALWSACNCCCSVCSFFLPHLPSSPAWPPQGLQFLQGKPILSGITLSKGCNGVICCGTWSTSCSSSFSDFHVHTAVSHWFHPFSSVSVVSFAFPKIHFFQSPPPCLQGTAMPCPGSSGNSCSWWCSAQGSSCLSSQRAPFTWAAAVCTHLLSWKIFIICLICKHTA